MTAETPGSPTATGGAAPAGSSNNIKVCIRVRPFNSRETGEQCVVAMPTQDTVQIAEYNTASVEPRSFSFDRCYWSHCASDANFATQETLMEELGEALLANALEGFNNCLFAYGQTGAGKTHSMLGGDGDQRGLLPRVLEGLFDRIGQAPPEVKFSTKVSYLEIYNENLRDLLVPLDDRAKNQLTVHYHPKIGTYVPGLTECLVTKYSEVNRMIDYGQKTRSVAATSMNATSSRSHCIFSFHLEKETGEGKLKQTVRAHVNLVDLAGSERQAKTNATGDRLKEGAMINQSLSTLATVINKLASVGSKSTKDFVPFRNSKLTHLLQESLSGNSKTVMVAAISPAKSNTDETMSTLRFAQTCKKIQTRVVKNQDSRQQVINDLKAEIERLRADLASGATGGLRDSVNQELSEETQALRKKLEEEQATIEKWEHQRALALDDMALTMEEIANEMGVDPNTPQLINISTDPSLSGCLVYYLAIDEVTQIGSADGCKIQLSGLGIQPYMCTLSNRDNSEVTLELLSPLGFPLDADGLREAGRPCSRKRPNGPGRVLVNGRAPTVAAQPMAHCDRLIIGHAYCFRLTIPATGTDGDTNNLLTTSSMEEALFEVVHEHSDEFAECQAMMESLKDRIGQSNAQDFLNLFGRTLPLVEEANLITSTVRPQDRLRFQVEVTSDILRYTSDEPELIVRLFQVPEKHEIEEETHPKEENVLGVFELPQFLERLAHIREVYNEFLHYPESLDLSVNGRDPWMPYGYNAIQEMLLTSRNQLEEEKQRREYAENEARQLRRRLAEAEARTRAALGATGAAGKGRSDPLELELEKASEGAMVASKLAQRLLENLQVMQLDMKSLANGDLNLKAELEGVVEATSTIDRTPVISAPPPPATTKNSTPAPTAAPTATATAAPAATAAATATPPPTVETPNPTPTAAPTTTPAESTTEATTTTAATTAAAAATAEVDTSANKTAAADEAAPPAAAVEPAAGGDDEGDEFF